MLSTFVATDWGFDRAEADWASRSNSAATSGRPIKLSLSGEPGGGVPSVVPALGAVVEELIRSVHNDNHGWYMVLDRQEQVKMLPPDWSSPAGEVVEDDFFNRELKKLAKTPSEVPLIPLLVASI